MRCIITYYGALHYCIQLCWALCIYKYICIHIYKYISIYTAHTGRGEYTVHYYVFWRHTLLHPTLPGLMCIYIHVCTCMYMYICTYMYVYIHVCVCIYMYIYWSRRLRVVYGVLLPITARYTIATLPGLIYIYVYMYICIYMYTYCPHRSRLVYGALLLQGPAELDAIVSGCFAVLYSLEGVCAHVYIYMYMYTCI